MARTNPVTDAERQRIRGLHSEGKSLSAIARELGRGKATISRECGKLGLSFDRAETRAATEANVTDVKARRAAQQLALHDDFDRLRKRAWESYTVVVGTGEGAETVILDLPPAQDTAAFYRSMAVCVDKGLAIDRHDSGDQNGLSAVDEWLRGMLGGNGT